MFPAYASLSLSYAMIYLPGTGIMAAYTEQQQFSEAVALYLFSWFILTTLFCVSAMRSSLILLLALIFFDLELLLLGCGFLLQNHGLLTAGYSMGFVAGFWACEYGGPGAGERMLTIDRLGGVLGHVGGGSDADQFADVCAVQEGLSVRRGRASIGDARWSFRLDTRGLWRRWSNNGNTTASPVASSDNGNYSRLHDIPRIVL